MNDMTLRQFIIDELEFQPSIDAADIGVAVEDGIVTLTGHVSSYFQKVTVEETVSRIKGVKGIAEEIEVRYPGAPGTSDDEIAKRAVELIGWNPSIPPEHVQVKVQNGWVTLTGKVDWQYQKECASEALKNLMGVINITNKIEVTPRATTEDVKQRIEDALKRNAAVEAQGIQITVVDGKVKLQGRVKAWNERGVAERAAWATPGVRQVEDHLNIG